VAEDVGGLPEQLDRNKPTVTAVVIHNEAKSMVDTI
jgi:hypothetical protein